MSTVAAAPAYVAPGWLRSRTFDLWFCCGPAALALIAGAVLVGRPQLFLLILFGDYWILSYHHVIATFTRLCFDAESFRAHRFLVLGLPVLLVASILLLIFTAGPWAVASLYFYWQWWHTTRQSYGIAQAYRRKAGDLITEDPRLNEIGLYLLPLWGILHRSYQAPGAFLTFPLKVVPLPAAVVNLVGFLALLYVVWWLGGRFVAWWQGRLPLAHTLYVLSHFVIFYVGYILIADVNQGWVVSNIWHTGQYLMFVWMFNTNRFRPGVDPKAKFLSTISQPRNAWFYFLALLTISSSVYLVAVQLVGSFAQNGLLAALLVYQTINFHHFIVDTVVWRMRRKEVASRLGLVR